MSHFHRILFVAFIFTALLSTESEAGFFKKAWKEIKKPFKSAARSLKKEIIDEALGYDHWPKWTHEIVHAVGDVGVGASISDKGQIYANVGEIKIPLRTSEAESEPATLINPVTANPVTIDPVTIDPATVNPIIPIIPILSGLTSTPKIVLPMETGGEKKSEINFGDMANSIYLYDRSRLSAQEYLRTQSLSFEVVENKNIILSPQQKAGLEVFDQIRRESASVLGDVYKLGPASKAALKTALAGPTTGLLFFVNAREKGSYYEAAVDVIVDALTPTILEMAIVTCGDEKDEHNTKLEEFVKQSYDEATRTNSPGNWAFTIGASHLQGQCHFAARMAEVGAEWKQWLKEKLIIDKDTKANYN